MLNVMQYVKRLRPIDELPDVNTKVDDGSEISELMSCFLQENVENAKFPCLSRRVSYLKNSEEVTGSL